MLQQYPKRLIEVDLPIKRISAHARREKEMRRGHVPQMYIWPATRPPSACRAVICAALWLDPADPNCPASFRDAAREQMRKWAKDSRGLLSAASYEHFEAVRKRPELINDDEMLRTLLLDFIADFANWDNSTRREYMETSAALTQAAHVAMNGTPGTKPLVVDSFAGGGAIPLEALRVGADAFASDLNPVAVLLNKVVLEYVPRYGQRLADEVRKWGIWAKPKAEERLRKFYPSDADGAKPIAYLWARAITCEGPNCGAQLPLMRGMLLARKVGRVTALRIITRRKEKRIDFDVVENVLAKEVDDGTVARGSATCPICGYTTPVASVRHQLQKQRGGTKTARLFCVVTTKPNEQGRSYRVARPDDLEACRLAEIELENLKSLHRGAIDLIPSEPLPPQGTLGFRVQLYGMKEWADLFTPRQLLALVTYSKLVREYIAELSPRDQGFADAVGSTLSLAVNKLADLNASLCGWQLNTPNAAHVFTRWVLPFIFDFAEVNPLAGAGGSPESVIRRLATGIEDLAVFESRIGSVQEATATKHPLPNDSADAFITDPPYYDAVPYADLSDFFYVWLRRTLPASLLPLFGTKLTPKDEECIVDEAKGKDRNYFEAAMAQAMAEGRRLLRPNGIGVVVFAHKSTAGWEAQLQAIVDAGWTVTASWPIDTEMGSRLRAHGSAALASSVHLVCRPRENPDGSVADQIGDWRDVLHELPRRIHEWMPRLSEEGVVGADAIFACLGPALEIFSRYSRVDRADGSTVLLKDYLEEVWAAVAREALTMVFEGADASGFEEDARLTAMWLWTISPGAMNGNGEDEEGAESEETNEERSSVKPARTGGFVLEFDPANRLAMGIGAHLDRMTSIVEIKGDKARLLPLSERTKYLFGKDEADTPAKRRKKEPQGKLFEIVAEVESEAGGWGSKNAPKLGDTVLDRVHQSMILFAAGRGDALKRFLVEDGAGSDERFWRLAQALVALYPKGTDERRWIEGVTGKKKGLGF